MRTSKLTQQLAQKFIRHMIGVFVSPVILFYKVAYWLMGKRCVYHWGNFDVTPLQPVTANEDLFARLFPTTIALLIFVMIWLGGGL